jgi:hypothetical protein
MACRLLCSTKDVRAIARSGNRNTFRYSVRPDTLLPVVGRDPAAADYGMRG